MRTNPNNKTPQETSFESIGEDIFKRWIVNPALFIQEIIITPYNEATGMNIVMSNQQRKSIEAVSELVQARLRSLEN